MKRRKGSQIIEGRAALVVVDAQQDFLEEGAPVRCPRSDAAISAIAQLIHVCHSVNVPVVYTRESHRPSGVDFECDGTPAKPEGGLAPHAVEGTPGAEFDHRILPEPQDIVLVPKRRYDAFMGTDLEIVLNGLDVYPANTLIIVGFVTNVCVLFTAAAAHQRDYWIRVVPQAVAATTEELHEAALKIIQPMQQHAVVALPDILGALDKYGRSRFGSARPK